MWVKIYFSKSFFFLSGPFQGGYFLGGIIYFAALDLVPSTLNLRPARVQLGSGIPVILYYCIPIKVKVKDSHTRIKPFAAVTVTPELMYRINIILCSTITILIGPKLLSVPFWWAVGVSYSYTVVEGPGLKLGQYRLLLLL
jgi:hypothetical protein